MLLKTKPSLCNLDSPYDKSKMTKEHFSLPVSGLRWNGMMLAHRRSRDIGVKQKKAKRHTNTDDNNTFNSMTWRLLGYAIGATFVIFLAAAFFIYAW